MMRPFSCTRELLVIHIDNSKRKHAHFQLLAEIVEVISYRNHIKLVGEVIQLTKNKQSFRFTNTDKNYSRLNTLDEGKIMVESYL